MSKSIIAAAFGALLASGFLVTPMAPMAHAAEGDCAPGQVSGPPGPACNTPIPNLVPPAQGCSTNPLNAINPASNLPSCGTPCTGPGTFDSNGNFIHQPPGCDPKAPVPGR
jgi:hypothetical protein